MFSKSTVLLKLIALHYLTFSGKKRQDMSQKLMANGVVNVKTENILFNRDNLKGTGKKQFLFLQFLSYYIDFLTRISHSSKNN